MKCQYITVSELPQFLNTEEYQHSDIIPISHQRARAQAINPRANEKDIALILLMENQKMMGYLGLLPDTIFFQDQAQKVAWMSCIWVNPNARGKGVATKLLEEAFKVWDNRLLATEFTAPAKKLYDKINRFDDLTIVDGIRAYLRFNFAVLLPKKNPRYLKIQFLLKSVDAVLNFFNSIRLFFYKKNVKNIRLEKINEIDQSTWQWIQKFQKNELFRRTNIDLNWLLKNPWLGNSTEAKNDAKRYHFSIYEKHFEFQALKIFLNERLIGFLILAIRGDALKVPYAYFENEDSDKITETIKNFMLDNNCSTLTIYNQPLIQSFQKKRNPFFIIRPFKRHYIISKAFAWTNQNQAATLQDGDGDCAFT